MASSRKPCTRIGVLGGAFDPPHQGHLQAALETLADFQMDRILLVPYCGSPTGKASEASPKDRLEMLRLAVQAHPGLEASDIELKRGGPSYTVDTLRELRKALVAGTELFLIMGRDAFEGIAAWKDAPELFKLANFVVNSRPGHPKSVEKTNIPLVVRKRFTYNRSRTCWWDKENALGIYKHAITDLPVSSTQIRQAIRSGVHVQGLLAPLVAEYIRRKGLYR